MKRVNEGSSFVERFQFYDENRVETSPITLRYRIECLTTKQSVRGWTTLTAAQSVDILVTPGDNNIIRDGNSLERKKMLVQSNFDTDTQAVFTAEWDVANLQGV